MSDRTPSGAEIFLFCPVCSAAVTISLSPSLHPLSLSPPPDADRGLSRDKSGRRVKLATSLHTATHLTITFQSPSTASFHNFPIQHSLKLTFDAVQTAWLNTSNTQSSIDACPPSEQHSTSLGRCASPCSTNLQSQAQATSLVRSQAAMNCDAVQSSTSAPTARTILRDTGTPYCTDTANSGTSGCH